MPRVTLEVTLKTVKTEDKVAQVPASLLGRWNSINQDICFRLYISKGKQVYCVQASIQLGVSLLQQLSLP